MRTIGLLLAAGRGNRFGTGNKLLATFCDRPLVTHAAAAMRGAGLDALVATSVSPQVDTLLEGFHLSRPEPDDRDQSGSLRAGCRDCLALGAERILVVLADMPLITSTHLRAVVERCGAGYPSASSDGSARMPPACFPAAMVPALMALTGDRGAGALLQALPDAALVAAPPGMLKDVDRPADLADAMRWRADLAN